MKFNEVKIGQKFMHNGEVWRKTSNGKARPNSAAKCTRTWQFGFNQEVKKYERIYI